MLTAQIVKDAIGCPLQFAELYTPHLIEGCAAYGIDAPARLAAFLAQLGHESGGFRYVREVWGPTPAQATYEGRKNLGNTEPGDGAKFKGHGLIQITGRYNHAAVRDRLRERFGALVPDFEGNPEMLEQPRWAVLSACDYWDSRRLNLLADNGDFEMITRRVNGGLNGQTDRLARWKLAKSALSVASHSNPTPQKDPAMPPFLLAALPSLLELIPKLGGIFKSGSEVSERNVKAVEVVVEAAKAAIGASNEQDLVEQIKANPAAAATVKAAVEAKWLEITEAGGGGIEGARKADAAAIASSGLPFWKSSPSFWIACLLLPLVYLILGNVTGLYGAEWSADARAGIAGSIAGGIVMGLIGYYYGQTTTRNRSAAPTDAS